MYSVVLTVQVISELVDENNDGIITGGELHNSIEELKTPGRYDVRTPILPALTAWGCLNGHLPCDAASCVMCGAWQVQKRMLLEHCNISLKTIVDMADAAIYASDSQTVEVGVKHLHVQWHVHEVDICPHVLPGLLNSLWCADNRL